MKNHRLSNLELSWLCRELAILLHAGVSIGDALNLLSEEENSVFAVLLADIGHSVDRGESLSAALRQSGSFPAYLTGMVEVGERTGRTEQALDSLAQYYARRDETQHQLRTVLTYPVILLLLMLLVVLILLTKVLPVFNEVYRSLGSELTGLAGGLLRLGEGLNAAMPLLVILLAGVAALILTFTINDAFRDKILTRWLRSRGDRGIARKLSDAQFAEALAMGMRSGLAPAEAAELAASLFTGLPETEQRCRSCARAMQDDGLGFTEALESSGLLSPAACRLLSFGLRGGAGDRVMSDIAQRLSDEAERALSQRIAQVEPTLVLVSSLLVGAILLSVMLPLMHIMAAIG